MIVDDDELDDLLFETENEVVDLILDRQEEVDELRILDKMIHTDGNNKYKNGKKIEYGKIKSLEIKREYSIPKSINKLVNLECILFSDCYFTELPYEFYDLENLACIQIENCNELKSISDKIIKFTKLEAFIIIDDDNEGVIELPYNFADIIDEDFEIELPHNLFRTLILSLKAPFSNSKSARKR